MSNSSRICVDANIVVRLTLSLDDTTIQQLWDSWIEHKNRLIAPTLLYYEVTNALYRLEQSGTLTSDFIQEALDFVLALPIELIGDRILHQHARDLACYYKLSATCDAHYVALTERMGADLWTADRRLFNTMKSFEVDWIHLVVSPS